MRQLLLFALLFFTRFAQAQFTAQQVDSMRTQLTQVKSDSARLRTLLLLGRGFLQLGLPDSMLAYAPMALNLATAMKEPRGQGVASFLLIWAYRHTGRYPQALQAAFSNLHRAEQASDSAMVLDALRHVMFTYNDMHDYAQALLYARRAKRLVHAGVFKNKPEFNHLKFAGYLNLMADAFDGLQQHDSALQYRREAYQIAFNLNYAQDLAVSSNGIGGTFLKQKLFDSAVFYYRACINHVQKAGFRHELAAEAQMGLANIYHVQNRPDSALHYATLALATAQRMKELDIETGAATLLHELYASHKAKDSAYRYLLLATTLRDSLVNKGKIAETERVKYTEALRRQKEEQEVREAAAKYQRRAITIGISAAAAVLLLAAFLAYRFRRLRREERMKSGFTRQIQQTELKALRAQMNPHFVFNCLNSINRYIVKSDHATASDYLSKFARLIRFILDNSAAETISLDKEVETLQLYLSMEALRFDRAFAYGVEVDEALWPESVAIPPMLLQPYVENAIWHGLLHKEAGGGFVRIRFRGDETQNLLAEIEDNGIGRRKAKELKSRDALRKKSYGMKITGERILLLNELYNTAANVRIEDLTDERGEGIGTRVTVTVPLRTVQPLAETEHHHTP